MPQFSIEQALQMAVQHQASGRFSEAQALCNQVLGAAPNHPAALHLLGAMASATGEFSRAVELLRQVVRMQPQNPGGHVSLGIALAGAGQLDEAVACHNRAISLNPNHAKAHCNLGVALASRRQFDHAIISLQRAISLQPNYPEALCNLGNAQTESGAAELAIKALDRAIALRPNYAEAHFNLANALAALKRVGEAADALDRAVAIRPNYAKAHANLGNALTQMGQIGQAIDCYEKALVISPDEPGVQSNRLLAMNYRPSADRGLLAEHVEWAQKCAARFYPKKKDEGERMKDENAPASSFILPPSSFQPQARLRVGYVSADFRQHAVASFLLPILSAHDPQAVEVFCYSNFSRADQMTRQMRSFAHRWREIWNQTDDQAAQMIRSDRIDILVDLAGHTAGNRLLVFARKPAPVQVTYLGYPNTTGLATMDWRITDGESDPPGMTESHYTEKLHRLAGGFLCYQPLEDAPPVRDFSAGSQSSVTFGTFNNFAKITDEMLALWARLLQAAADSKLLIKADTLGHERHQQRVRDAIARHGVDPTRVELIGRQASFVDHLKAYHRVDIGLDTFPYHGTTTTCEAMWMGVPVVTLAGHAHVSRVGVSLLTRVGLSEMVAQSHDEYVAIAAELARDTARRRTIAAGLRDRMRNSPLMDAKKFVRDLENGYRAISKDV